MKLIKNYFNNTKKYGVWQFIIEMSVAAFAFKMVAILIAVPFFYALGINTETNLELEKVFLMILYMKQLL